MTTKARSGGRPIIRLSRLLSGREPEFELVGEELRGTGIKVPQIPVGRATSRLGLTRGAPATAPPVRTGPSSVAADPRRGAG